MLISLKQSRSRWVSCFPRAAAQTALPQHGTCVRYLLTKSQLRDWGSGTDRWSATIHTWDIIWHFLLIIFTSFMQQICLLSCYLNIDTLLNVAYGGLLLRGILEAANSRKNFNSDIFMLKYRYKGYVCLNLSYYDFHKTMIVSLPPIIFETDISWK